MSTNPTPRSSVERGQQLYQEQRGKGPFTEGSEDDSVNVTFGTPTETDSSGRGMAAGKDLYHRRHGKNGSN